jgi:hypothetical protein
MSLIPEPQLSPNIPLNQPGQVEAFSFDAPANDEQALALVIQNFEKAEKYLTSRLWITEWRAAKILYEAPVSIKYWKDTNVRRSSLTVPLIQQHIRSILPQVMQSLFIDNPAMMFKPDPGTSEKAARATTTLVWDLLLKAGVKKTFRLAIKDGLLFGTDFIKYGHEQYPVKRHKYVQEVKPPVIKSNLPGVPDQEVESVESEESYKVQEWEEMVSRPFACRVEIQHLLVDPGLRVPDLQDEGCGYVIHILYPTLRDLDRLRGYEGWNIPSREELIELAKPPAEEALSRPMESESALVATQGHRAMPRYLDSSEDPLDHKLELFEMWTRNNVTCVLQRKKIIRNESNEWGKIPFLNSFWDDIPGSFYGYGIARQLGSAQRHLQGLRNSRMDDIALNLQNMWLKKRGSSIAAQPIKSYPGACYTVDNMEDLKPLVKQPILPEAYKEEEVLLADAEKTTGANELIIQGSMPQQGRSSMGRTAAGANLIASGSGARIQEFVEVIAEQQLIPLCNAFLEIAKEKLPIKEIRKILGPAYAESFQILDLFNAEGQFQCLAASKLQARRAMAQALPIEFQTFAQPAVQQGLSLQGKKIDWVKMCKRLEQTAGWNDSDEEGVVVDMNDEDKQRATLQNPNVMGMKATAARLAQIHDNKLGEIDAQGIAGLGQKTLDRVLERTAVNSEMPEVAGGIGQ